MALAEIIYDTAANWAFNNPILEAGQIGVESDVRNGVQTGTAQAKFGDGVSRWNSLSYWQPTSLQLSQTQLTNLATTGTTNGVKVYRALLTQTGTDAPVATVLENTLGGTVVWTYNNDGTYIGTLAGAFPEGKVSQWSGICGNGADSSKVYAVSRDGSDDEIIAYSFASDSLTNSRLSGNYVEILVYP